MTDQTYAPIRQLDGGRRSDWGDRLAFQNELKPLVWLTKL